jgi:hypothetical protein
MSLYDQLRTLGCTLCPECHHYHQPDAPHLDVLASGAVEASVKPRRRRLEALARPDGEAFVKPRRRRRRRPRRQRPATVTTVVEQIGDRERLDEFQADAEK